VDKELPFPSPLWSSSDELELAANGWDHDEGDIFYDAVRQACVGSC
jgi:hypothetical protein